MMIKGKDKYGLKNCILMMRQKGRFTNVMWEKKGVCGLKIDKEEWWGQEIKVEECNTDQLNMSLIATIKDIKLIQNVQRTIFCGRIAVDANKTLQG